MTENVNRYVLNGAQLTYLMHRAGKEEMAMLEQIEEQWIEQSEEELPNDVKKYRKLLEK